MNERGLFLYKGLDGTVYISFEEEGALQALDPLLPTKLQGKNYEEAVKSNSIAQFFELADMILVTADSLKHHVDSLDMTGVTQHNPIKTRSPHFDLDFLNLRAPSGHPSSKKTEEILTVAIAYWENPKDMAISVGYVAEAWHRGIPAKEIIKFIRDNTLRDSKTGKLKLVLPEATPEEQLLGRLLPPDVPFAGVTKEALENLTDWLSSAPRVRAFRNSQQQKATDTVFLGLVDFSGNQDQAAIKAAREYIWERVGQSPNFKALWRHIQASKGIYPAHDAKADYGAYNARIAELYDQNASNTTISEVVLKLSKSSVPVPTDHLCFAAWLVWQMGRAGQYNQKLLEIFNKQPANWLASDAANAFLHEVFSQQSQTPLPLGPKTGRNDLCPCGSGKKFKKCCGRD